VLAAGGTSFDYHGNGFVNSVTDFDGNVTTYTFAANGEETSRTEASGTGIARTTTSIGRPGSATRCAVSPNTRLLVTTISCPGTGRKPPLKPSQPDPNSPRSLADAYFASDPSPLYRHTGDVRGAPTADRSGDR
jgi:YD repeat-containing protein